MSHFFRARGDSFEGSQLQRALDVVMQGLAKSVAWDGRSECADSLPCKQKRRAQIGHKSDGKPNHVIRPLPVISNVPIVGPLVNTLLSPLVLLAVYAYGCYRFMSGFSKTPYADTLTTKVGLTALWPVLFVISQKFRSNFKRAVQ
ncbi:hypothetical protein KP509_1Z154900 [Ceratopteris richardii]|nr:hypothetical protein KP509_1Z154900 [Ceratopteris richardii]